MPLASGCRGESLPDDPRPAGSAEQVVPVAAFSALLAFSSAPGPGTPLTTSPLSMEDTSAIGSVRADAPELSRPALPALVVERITSMRLGPLRLYYERALRSDPTLSGTVVAKYVIGSDGSVTSAKDAGSTIGNPTIIAAVLRALRLSSFPNPAGGPVTVTQTYSFTPAAPGSSPY
jgi:outer membrane biosynthesis protein TonB